MAHENQYNQPLAAPQLFDTQRVINWANDPETGIYVVISPSDCVTEYAKVVTNKNDINDITGPVV